jgi:hypothetical protein
MEVVQDLIFGEVADAWETIEIVVLSPESGLGDESGSFGNANDLLRGEHGMELDFSIDLLELEALAGFEVQ